METTLVISFDRLSGKYSVTWKDPDKSDTVFTALGIGDLLSEVGDYILLAERLS